MQAMLCKQSDETTKHILLKCERLEAKQRSLFGALNQGRLKILTLDKSCLASLKVQRLPVLLDLQGSIVNLG